LRLSHQFGSTLRDAPANIEAVGHQLLVRAGFIRQLGHGSFAYLPPARRSLAKIENILREEMNAIGGQEVGLPSAHSAEIRQSPGRRHSIGPQTARFKDRAERDTVSATAYEEIVTHLCRSEIRSYRQLPQLLYQIRTKSRDDARPRTGLIHVREFTTMESYSLDADEAGLDRQYRAHYQAYANTFHRCGLPVVAALSDPGITGGSQAHVFLYLAPVGEDTLVSCAHCGYAADGGAASFAKPAAPPEDLKPVEKVATPGCKTIEALAKLLEVPKRKTAKAVFMMAEHWGAEGGREEFICAVVRGDMEVNEVKLAKAAGAVRLRPATDEEIRATGAVPGYASPIGLQGVRAIVDDAVVSSPNLVAGANEEGYHLLHTNIFRDYRPAMVTDIAAAGAGDACPLCGRDLRASRVVETAGIVKIGTRYSDAVGATYLSADGEKKPIVMGSYGIGVGRLLACIAEEHHDDKGLMWPVTVAPYSVHLVSLGQEEAADRIYGALRQAGLEVLYDDRQESPGVKFNDADLIGVPIRITVSARSLAQGGVEMKRRDQTAKETVSEASLVERLQSELRSRLDEMSSRIVRASFPTWK
jgi:prolyl-tRNA synthetase